MDNFQYELQELINKHNMENASNTPDFILADYLDSCLRLFNIAIQQREKWHHNSPFKNNEIGNKTVQR